MSPCWNPTPNCQSKFDRTKQKKKVWVNSMTFTSSDTRHDFDQGSEEWLSHLRSISISRNTSTQFHHKYYHQERRKLQRQTRSISILVTNNPSVLCDNFIRTVMDRSHLWKMFPSCNIFLEIRDSTRCHVTLGDNRELTVLVEDTLKFSDPGDPEVTYLPGREALVCLWQCNNMPEFQSGWWPRQSQSRHKRQRCYNLWLIPGTCRGLLPSRHQLPGFQCR